MENYIIIFLLLILICKDEIKRFFTRKSKQENANKEEIEKQKEYKEQFERLMEYSIENAVESKKVN